MINAHDVHSIHHRHIHTRIDSHCSLGCSSILPQFCTHETLNGYKYSTFTYFLECFLWVLLRIDIGKTNRINRTPTHATLKHEDFGFTVRPKERTFNSMLYTQTHTHIYYTSWGVHLCYLATVYCGLAQAHLQSRKEILIKTFNRPFGVKLCSQEMAMAMVTLLLMFAQSVGKGLNLWWQIFFSPTIKINSQTNCRADACVCTRASIGVCIQCITHLMNDMNWDKAVFLQRGLLHHFKLSANYTF